MGLKIFSLLAMMFFSTTSWAVTSGGNGDSYTIDADHHIEGVVVYPSQATIRHTAKVDIPPGEHKIVLKGFPIGLMKDSVRVVANGDQNIVLGDVDIQENTDVSQQDKIAEIDRKINDLNNQINEAEANIESYKTQEEFIKKSYGADFVKEILNGKNSSSMKDIGDLWGVLRKTNFDSEKSVKEQSLLLKGLKSKLEALNNEKMIKNKTPLQEMIVSITTINQSPVKANFTVSYQINNAHWRPYYEAHLGTVQGEVDLTEGAIVEQTTGEDWNGIDLTLSTTKPALGVNPPLINTLNIGLNSLQPLSKSSMDRSFVPAMAGSPPSPIMAMSSVMKEAGQQMADIVDSEYNVEYQIPNVVNIISGNGEKKVILAKRNIEGKNNKIWVRSYPRFDQNSYLYSEFKNPESYPLLTGDIGLYQDGVFIGHTRMTLIRPNEIVKIPFGIDDKVKVSRVVKKQFKTEEDNLISKNHNVKETEIEIKVQNFHTKPMNVVVVESLPVSTDNDLKVDNIMTPTPTSNHYDDKVGVMAWEWTLKNMEEKSIQVNYTITAPQGRVIVGLPE